MKPHASQINDTAILANADHFEISLFLGRGQFAKADAKTLDEARSTAALLLAAHADCNRRPIIYAVSAEGRSAPVA